MMLLSILGLFITHSVSFESCEGDYCPTYFPKLPVPITSRQQQTVYMGRDTKTGCFCRELPEVFVVCFGRDTCSNLPVTVEVKPSMLRITDTVIKVFKPGDFSKLSHLTELQLEGNPALNSILPCTFENMTSLVNLSISFNTKLKYLHQHSFAGLTGVKNLLLMKNGFQNLVHVTPSLRPNYLHNLTKLVLDSNTFVSIDKTGFIQMKNSSLTDISLGLCRIEHIHPDALLPLKNLEILQLHQNSINSSTLSILLNRTLEAKINLKVLNLFYVGYRKHPPRNIMNVISKSNISALNLARNNFEQLTNESFPYMPNIEMLDLREVLALNVTSDAFASLPNLKILMLSGNKLVSVPKGVLLKQLLFLDIQQNSEEPEFSSYFLFKHDHFINMTQLIYLNLGYNTIVHLFNRSFAGLKNLKFLGLKTTSLFNIEHGSFVPLENLEVLDLRNNAINHGAEIPDVFHTLTKLKVLRLGGCGFSYIPAVNNPFRNLLSLEQLELNHNGLVTISPNDFLPLFQLKVLNLQRNLFSRWQQRLFQNNSKLTQLNLSENRISTLTSEMLQDFLQLGNINLEHNNIVCNCFEVADLNLSHLQSIFKPQVNCAYPSSLENVPVAKYFQDITSGEVQCKKTGLVTILSSCIGVVILVCVVFSVFYFKWQIKYLLFLTTLYLSRKGRIIPKRGKEFKDDFVYDAFVSYSSEDRDFVVNLVKTLENQEPFYKLCVYERDFLVGNFISECVLVCMAQSRKTLIVVSDNYAQSQWCRWESHVAEYYRLFTEREDGDYVDDSLVLIKLSAVSKCHMSPLLKYLLKTRIYLEWSTEENRQKLFFEKMRNSLGVPLECQLRSKF
ncbi:toll-like receptor 2 [Cylas formicarius]|uniref:toll-like receptor 2 n=1 Tax=Cylas formicarius TaxID=197179 RepID=UPI0029588689|nr:toll-like receptor 2 [Cylas formicarius]